MSAIFSPSVLHDDAVDVLIPVHNGAAWLQASLQSIQRQTHRALCVHVVDDGSTDATPQILARLTAADDRIRVHRQANAGIVDALNHGLLHCSSAFIARHDADDLADPTRIKQQLAYLASHPDCVAVGAVARHIDDSGHVLGTLTLLRPPEAADAAWFPAREPYLMHPFMIARRSALVAAGGYRAVLHAEDSDLYWRLRELGRLHNLDEVLGSYRLHAASVSSASVHNGRVMAVSSQLAALSAVRRTAGSVDLRFGSEQGKSLRAAASLQAMVERATAQLTAQEQAPFALAVAAKLLELADDKPYELEPGDCAFIAQAVQRHSSCITRPGNRRSLAVQLLRSAQRLAQAGRWDDARTLLRPWQWPEFAARLALRRGLTAASRRRLHALLHQRGQAAP